MGRGSILLVGLLAVVVVAIWAVVAAVVLPAIAGDGAASAPPSPLAGVASATPSIPATPSGLPVSSDLRPSAAGSGAPASPGIRAVTPPAATPSPTSDRTAGSGAPTDAPGPRFRAFIARLADDRAQVGDLDAALLAAAQADDPASVRSTAVDILRFADAERDWLLGHPPADCYAAAHTAAGTMLEAYATVADRAIEWVDAERGLAALDALAAVFDAASAAQAAVPDLTRAVEAATCPR